MSIIYDALNKTKPNSDLKMHASLKPRVAVREKGKPWLFFLVAALFTLAVGLAFQHFSTPAPAKRVLTPLRARQVAMLPSARHPFSNAVASGVMLSRHERMAMINDKQYHVGDQLADMKIVAINSDAVSVQCEHGSRSIPVAGI